MNEQNICKINETFVKGNELNMKKHKKVFQRTFDIIF